MLSIRQRGRKILILERNMKKRLVMLIALCLATVFALPAPSARAATLPENQNIRIGLYYGSNALPGANLLNSTGSGYRLGYYNDALEFQTLASTAETAISVVKTQNVYYFPLLSDGFQGYTDAQTSEIAVGCYHIQLPGSYATYEETMAAIAASGVAGAFPAWINGTYYVRTGAYLDADAVNAANAALGIEGTTVVGTSTGGVSVVKTGTAQILFQFDGGSQIALGVLPGLDDSVKTTTWFKGRKYFGGFRFERIGGGNLTVVNILYLEDYVNCVISQEMSNSWPVEALKAQACCARTYAARLNRHAAYHFDLCATVDCQAYPGAGQIGANTTQAVEETAGMYVWYGDELAETYYYSSNGGASEDVRNIWNSNVDLPYLCGVVDPYEATVADKIYLYNWTYTFTSDKLTEKMRASGRNCAQIVNLYVSAYTDLGNVRSITLVDANGDSWSFYGSNATTFLGVRSIRFNISGGGTYYVNDGAQLSGISGAYAIGGDGTTSQITTGTMPYVITGSGVEQLPASSSDTFTVTGSGWGHNVGMSQWGAYAMSLQGFTYDQILKFYYPGVEIR